MTRELDQAVVEFLTESFFEGERVEFAQKLLASLGFLLPRQAGEGGRLLTRSKRAVRGWARLAPPVTRMPLPWPVAAALCHELVRMGAKEAAIATAVTFSQFLRPVEMLRLQPEDVVAPPRRGPRGTRAWALILHPEERGQPSKVGLFNETVVADNVKLYPFLRTILPALAKRPKGRPALALTYSTWAHQFRAAGERLHLRSLGPPTLYQLRHGGASHESWTEFRGVADIKLKGRWASDASLRRYCKGGRVNQILRRLPAAMQKHAELCASSLAELLSGRCSARPPPHPTG